MNTNAHVSRRAPSSTWVWLLAVIIILGQAVLAWTATRTKSMTNDEIAHLTGGVGLWSGEYRLVPENGNLPQRVGALPAVIMGAHLAPLKDNGIFADVWTVGFQTWFRTKGTDHWPSLTLGRAAMTIFLMGTSAMVFWWARRMWGDAAGLLALSIAALSPTMLAHGALITSDMAATLLLPLSAGLFWWHLHRADWLSLTIVSTSVSLACVAKFSAALLVPTFLFLDLFWLASRRGGGKPICADLLRLLRDHAVIVATAIAVIWSFHGWRFAPEPAQAAAVSSYARPWEWALGSALSTRRALLEALLKFKVFPEAFTYGAGYMASSAESRMAFFIGEIGRTGWRLFFPYAFMVKTPLATLALTGIGLAAVLAGWRRQTDRIKAGLYAAAPLLTWSVIYAVVAINSHLNIGERHLLPLYPGLFILCGAAATLGAKVMRLAVMSCLALLATASFAIRPHYLSYFNELVGGPSMGYHHLVDSSLDWGQDLPALSEWLNANNPERLPTYISIFGVADPRYYGIEAELLTFHYNPDTMRTWFRLRGGYYAISASMLQLHSRHAEWTPLREHRYRLFRQKAAEVETNPSLLATDPRETSQLLKFVEQERVARLCAILRQSTPVAMPGYSILVYKLSDTDAQAIDLGGAQASLPPSS